MGWLGLRHGQVQHSHRIATDAAGNVYVADFGNLLIQKFTSSGTFLTQWGGSGSGNGKFMGPAGVATDSASNVYVTDDADSLVQKFTSGGTFLTQWGGMGSGNGKFSSPVGVGTDGAGNVYVGDSNNLVQKFTSSGAFLTQWGGTGSGNGKFSGPDGIATDCRGNVYVADDGNNLIQKFGEPGSPALCPIPSNVFSLGKLKLNKKRGTAKQAVNVPGAGTLVLGGKGVVPQRVSENAFAVASMTVTGPGTVQLLIRPKGKAKHKLKTTGKVKLTISVTFTPTGGAANTQGKGVKLKKKR